jgi:hypothetical protein
VNRFFEEVVLTFVCSTEPTIEMEHQENQVVVRMVKIDLPWPSALFDTSHQRK